MSSPYMNDQTCRAQNPALRHELSFEMGQMHSDTALHFGATDDDTGTPKPVLPQKFYSKAPPRFTCVQNFGADDDDVGGSKPAREGKSIAALLRRQRERAVLPREGKSISKVA